MDMLKGEQIAEAGLTDWRKLAQGLHARYVVDDLGAGARFLAAVGEAGDALGHHPHVSMGSRYVDLKLVTDDAIYRDDEGTEHVVEWVTQQDVDLARRITEIAADLQCDAEPSSVSHIELGLDTAHSAAIAPVWAVLMTGNTDAQGRGTPSDEIRDATGRVPNLWFGDADEHETPRQRFHIEVYVAPEVAQQRLAAAVATGGTVVDDSNAPSLTVIADQDGNKGIVCVDVSAARSAGIAGLGAFIATQCSVRGRRRVLGIAGAPSPACTLTNACWQCDDVMPSPWPMHVDSLLLREVDEADIARLLTFRNDPNVNRFMLRTSVEPELFSREWLAVATSEKDFSCVAEADGEIVAMGFLEIVDGMGQPEMPRGTEGLIGFIIEPHNAGRGFATSIASGLLAAAFDHLHLRRVTAGCFADNAASARVLERVGMRLEQHGIQDNWHAERGWVDGYTYAILASEWRPRRSS